MTSLLSRISGLNADDYAPTSSKIAIVPSERNGSDEGEDRPAKRRALSDDKLNVDQNALFTPWLDRYHLDHVDVSLEERLHHELLQFVEYISPSKEERDARRILVERIELLLRTRWPDAHVTLFGSSATGLELTGGDVDLVVSFDSSHSLSDVEKKRRLAAMGDVLRRSGMTNWVNRIFGAKVPIITFVTNAALGEVSIDISIRNDEDSGPRAIPLVKQFLAELPALRPLILAVKAFLSFRDLNDASQGTLSSYAITLMCINFLQRNPAHRAQKLLDDPYSEKSIGLLLMDLFRHYGHDFSYATHYISVADRGIFTRKSKNWELKENGTAVLAIQCILIPENNITRGCTKISLIVDAFKEAYHTLQSSICKGPSNVGSLLHRIYDIPKEDDESRHWFEEAVKSGAFSRSVASCCIEAPKRAVSGGVFLSTHQGTRGTDYGRDKFRPPIRLGTGPAQLSSARSLSRSSQVRQNRARSGAIQEVQQLPVRRWTDDRSQAQSGLRLPNSRFEFQALPNYYQQTQQMSNDQGQGPQNLMQRLSQQMLPTQGFPLVYNTGNVNGVNYANVERPQQQNYKRTYNGRH